MSFLNSLLLIHRIFIRLSLRDVKGTTSDLCDSVMMTKNEVELHKNEKGNTGLIIVSKIKLNRDPASPTATGGSVESLLGWDIDQWVTEPIAFQVSRH